MRGGGGARASEREAIERDWGVVRLQGCVTYNLPDVAVLIAAVDQNANEP